MKTVLSPMRASLLAGVVVLFSSLVPLGAQSYQTLTLVQPTNGATFFSGSDIKLVATAADVNQTIVSVSFFDGSQLLGAGAASPGPFGQIYTLQWTNVPAGAHQIFAMATRRQGMTNYSRTNDITVLPSHDISFVWLNPTNGQNFPGPGNIGLFFGVSDTNGSIALVDVFDGSRSLGAAMFGPILDPPFPPGWTSSDRPYSLDWTNQSIGTHVLTIGALDTNGQVAYSPPLTVFIGSNLPPVVRIVSPPNHADLHAPINVALAAYANDPDGTVASVQFYVGTTNLGNAQGVAPLKFEPLVNSIVPPIPPPLTNFFVLTWTNAPLGTFTLTALATDAWGASSTSAPVTLTILPSSPPETNYPDIVNILATDPIAIASTNCWVWRGLTNGSGTWTQWLSPIAVWRAFTNCGPKDATFTVHRFGLADSNVIVNYTLSGTASDGIDYALLPGAVTIPAGQRTADIAVVPIENNSNYIHSIVLTLQPSTNSSPDYVLGAEARAEGLIIDGVLPPFGAAALLGDDSFHLDLPGPDGAWFRIDFSTNLVDWTAVCTNQVVDGSIDFADPNTAGSTRRLYRIVPLAGPPSE